MEVEKIAYLGSPGLRRSTTGLEDVYSQEVCRITFQTYANDSGKSDSKKKTYRQFFTKASDKAAATEVALKGLVAKLAT